MGKHIMGDISTCNLINKLNNMKNGYFDKEWNYHRPRTFLIGFPIWKLKT